MVRCDVTGTLARCRGAVRLMRQEQLKGIEQILNRAVALEKSTHRYQNRTGLANSSTGIIGSISGDRYELALVIGAKYAIYLERGGWTNIRQIAQQARVDVRAYLKDFRDRVIAAR